MRLGGVAGCGSECTTGSSSTRPPRAKAGDDANQVAMVAQVLKLRLGNEHNFCYGNAMLHGLLALSLRVGGPEGFFPPLLCSILSGALSQGRVFHIWTNPFWRALVRGWPRPESQHDIAEFLQYLVGQCPGLADKIGVVWASIDEASGEHLDGGCFVPLYLHPPTCALGSGAEATTVQQMLDCWHRQETVHAVLQCPPGFVLQVGRFEFDTQSGYTRKQRYRITLDRMVELPLVGRAGSIMRVKFELCAVAYHLGETPVSGHYKALVLHNDTFYVVDDGVSAQRCSLGDLDECSCNSYLFFYSCMPDP